ncbi:hypothetical protein SCP_0402500 [Sparassis crispa]|uniref:Uncharacterized protein n=1 Tax=Sparassis crispa TaxID=139825 RepID=A0A401GI57_9APHY|nr:hypothetical protein SCP_0402500 [Sparassis crispa]GBE81876.1 hypothetical protein SCP_0402500 [Sparassis crispa]
MERYCGALQPAIRSRRHPYACLNRYVLDKARLTQIKLIYGIKTELSFAVPYIETGTSIPGYPTCVVLPTRRITSLDQGLLKQLLATLCTRFSAPASTIRKVLSPQVEEWSKLRILNDGDTIRAAESDCRAEDERDASFVRYELLVDKNARYHNRPVVLEKTTFYGQVRRLFICKLNRAPSIGLQQPSTSVLLAAIRTCDIEETDNVLDIHYYSKMGRLDIVDITTIQCVVGRVHDRQRWAVIDRSGTLSRAIYIDDTVSG